MHHHVGGGDNTGQREQKVEKEREIFHRLSSVVGGQYDPRLNFVVGFAEVLDIDVLGAGGPVGPSIAPSASSRNDVAGGFDIGSADHGGVIGVVVIVLGLGDEVEVHGCVFTLCLPPGCLLV